MIWKEKLLYMVEWADGLFSHRCWLFVFFVTASWFLEASFFIPLVTYRQYADCDRILIENLRLSFAFVEIPDNTSILLSSRALVQRLPDPKSQIFRLCIGPTNMYRI